mgnify:CR=1 FL=1
MSGEQELYGLLVPLLDERLLVPRACVAEVTGFRPLQEMPGAPPWYLGIAAWNGRGIPVISFEGACGKRIPVIGGRTRIVIFACLGQKLPAANTPLAATITTILPIASLRLHSQTDSRLASPARWR